MNNGNEKVVGVEVSVEDALYKIYDVLSDIKEELSNLRIGA